MAAGDREKTFTLRAADLSSQPIKDVVAQVDKLIASQKTLNDSAKAGTVSNADYSKAIGNLNTAFTALVNQKSALNEFIRLQSQIEKSASGVAAAQERLEAAQSKAFGGADQYTVITAKQSSALERLEKSLSSAQNRFAQTQGNIESSAKALEAMGIATTEVASAQQTLTKAIDAAIPALKEARIEELSLVENRRKGIAVSEAAAAARKKEAAEEVAFAAASRAANAERLAAATAITNREKADAEARSNARKFDVEQAFAAADAEAALAKRREEAGRNQAAVAAALAASQEKIAHAAKAVPAIQAAGEASNVPSSFSGASDAIAGLADPARAARQTLTGLDEQVNKIALSMREGTKRVEDYQKDMRELVVLFADASKLAALADTFKNQTADLARLSTELQKETHLRDQMVASYAKGNVASAEAERRILAQNNAVRTASEAYNQQNTRLTQTQGALQRAGADYKEIEVTVLKLTETAKKAKEAYDIADRARVGKNGDGTVFLGLKKYELIDLSYQINDVATQLASGTHIGQVFAQQFGQIFQIFERDGISAFSKLKDYPGTLGLIGAGAIAATFALLAMTRALEIGSERRSFIGQLALDVDGARINIGKLIESSKELQKFGVGTADAIGGAKVFAAQGFDEKQSEQLSKLAALLTSTGKFGSFGDAVKELSADFAGGYKELGKFMDLTKSFDAATARRIRDLYEEGNAAQAYALEIEVATKRASDAQEKSTTAISAFYNHLKTGFDGFLDNFNKGLEVVANGFLRLAEISDNQARGTYGAKDYRNQTSLGLNGLAGTSGTDNTQATTAPANSPQGFAAQRDRAADIAGVHREVFKYLQESENVADKNGRFGNGDGAVSGTGIGPAQVLKSTFEDLKKQFPELLKGPITDLQTNLIAGALYYRQQLVKAGGDVEAATNLYKGTSERPEYAGAALKVAQLAARAGNPIVKPQPELLNKPLEVTSAPKPTVGEDGKPLPTEGQKRTTDDYLKDVKDSTNAQRDSRLEGEASKDREKAIIEDEGNRIRTAAQAYAKEHNEAAIDNAAVDKAIEDRADVRRAQYAEARIQKEREAAQAELRAQRKVFSDDPTNLDERLKGVDEEFEAIRKRIEENFKGVGGAQKVDGKDKQQLLADVELLRNQAVNNETLKVAEATLDKLLKSKKEALQLSKDAGELGVKANQSIVEANQKFNPQIRTAIDSVNSALTKVPDTAAKQEARGKALAASTDLGGAQTDTNAALKEAYDRTQKTLQALIQERQNSLNDITEREKLGTLKVGEAVKQIAEVTSRLGPQIDAAVAKANSDLRAILSNPAISPELRNEINAAMTKNLVEAARSSEQVKAAVEAGIKDSQEKLKADLDNRNAQTNDVVKEFTSGQGDIAAASAKLREISVKFNAQIKADAELVVKNLETALNVPNLSAGVKATLQKELDKAKKDAEGEADTNPDNDASRKLLNAGVESISKARNSVTETESLNKNLTDKNLTTPDQADASNKRAYDEANKLIEQQTKDLSKLLDEYEKLHGSSTYVDNLRAKIKLLNGELKYVDPELKLVSNTLETSIASRGEQAFTSIAKSIANVATGGGKLKDVFAATGQAFATMAAGIIEDVAKVILKYELLKLIKGVIGGASDGFNYTSDGSGDGYSPNDSSGIDEASGSSSSSGSSTASTALGAFGTVAKLVGSFFHSGGTVSSAASNVRKPVDMSLFFNARRMHDGGTVGLANDEVPAILQRGEKVQSVAEVKQAAAASAGGGSSATPIRNVLAVGDDEISKAMNGSHGEQVVINHLRRNAPTVRKLIGS